ncbi:MAG: ABC transporter permease, partial [Candidatus Hinthialibacter sp.]
VLVLLEPLQTVLVAVAAGLLGGALWGWIAAVLKNRRGVNEVISTIMLNFIAFQFVNELTFGAFNAGEGASRTAFVRESARLPVLAASGASDISSGILLSIAIAAALSWILYRTWFGFSLRAMGDNSTACRYAGISAARMYRWAMLIGGGCAGLAGAIQVTGIDHTFYARFSGGYGFDGIAVAFLSLCEPWAAVPAALVIATLRAADRTLQLDVNLPKEMIFLLEGVLIVCIAVFTRRRDADSR